MSPVEYNERTEPVLHENRGIEPEAADLEIKENVADFGGKPPPLAPNASAVLGQLKVTDRNGHLIAARSIWSWPITLGRALACDVVLDDATVAPAHLQISRVADAAVQVQVLDTVNGVTLKRRKFNKDSQFEWPAGQELTLGRLRIALRLAEEVLPVEQLEPRFSWWKALWTLLSVVLFFASLAWASWINNAQNTEVAKQLPAIVMIALLFICLWTGLWALATRMFTGTFQLGRHIQIATWTWIGIELLPRLGYAAAFAFSWEFLAQQMIHCVYVVLAWGLFKHVVCVVPQRKKTVLGVVLAGLVLGSGAWITTQWLETKRFSDALYLSTLMPPNWRVAPAVPLSTFMQETQILKQRLDKRMQEASKNEPSDVGEFEE